MRELVFGQAFGALFEHRAEHIGDNVARALDDHHVAFAYAEAAYLVLVVERGALDHDAAKAHGFEFGHGGEHAGAAYLDGNFLQPCHGLAGGELPCRSKARGTCSEAEGFLRVEVVQLEDHAVDLEGQVVAALFHAFHKGKGIGGTAAEAAFGRGLEAPAAQGLHEFAVLMPAGSGRLGGGNGRGRGSDHRSIEERGLHRARGFGRRRWSFQSLLGRGFGLVAPVQFAKAVGKKAELAAGGDAGVELAQGTGGGVARVGEKLLPEGGLPFVQIFEFLAEHQYFATHFDELGAGLGKAQGKAAHGAHGLCDHFAHFAVATGEGLREHAVLVGEFAGKAVELGVGPPCGHDVRPGFGQGAFGTLAEGLPFLG